MTQAFAWVCQLYALGYCCLSHLASNFLTDLLLVCSASKSPSMFLGHPALWNEMKPSWVAQFPFVLLEGNGQKVWDDILLEYMLGAFLTLLGQAIQGSGIIWGNVRLRPEWWCSLKSSGKVKPHFGCNFKSGMLVNRQLSWPEHHLTVFLHPLVEAQQTEMSQNTGSRVEAHLQVDNQ